MKWKRTQKRRKESIPAKVPGCHSQAPSQCHMAPSPVHEGRRQKSLIPSCLGALPVPIPVPKHSFSSSHRPGSSCIRSQLPGQLPKRAFPPHPIGDSFRSRLTQQRCPSPSWMLSLSLLVFFLLCFCTGSDAADGKGCTFISLGQ